MKAAHFIVLGVISFVVTFFLIMEFSQAIEEMYKTNYLYFLLFSVLALLFRLETNILASITWKSFYGVVFALSFSSALAMLIKSFVTNSTVSYVGLTFLFSSLPFLVLAFPLKSKVV